MAKRTVEQIPQNKELKPHKIGLNERALIIGGGIAGIRATLDIANAGFPVVLVEKKPTIGGHAAQLGQIFPTMDLASKILTPLMNEIWRHPNIKLLTLSEIMSIEGDLGNFHVRIKKKPRQVDPDKCDLCKGLKNVQCVEVCPVTFPSEFDEGLTLRKAIYIPFPQAVPSTYTIDGDICISCGKCAQPEICVPGAIDLADEEEVIEEDVGVVIIATGYELHCQKDVEKYGIEECPDVVTSLQFERMLSPEGPTAGKPRRPSDGKIPKKIAFLHCDGSKKERHLSGWSDIHSAYLTKQAILFKKLVPNAEVYLNVSAEVSKNHERLIKKAQEEAGVNYVQMEVSETCEQDRKVKLLGANSLQGKSVEIEVDMVVLALPMMPFSGIKGIVDQMRIEAKKNASIHEIHQKSNIVESITPGVFIAGSVRTLMDIQNTMIQASKAASKAIEVLTRIAHKK